LSRVIRTLYTQLLACIETDHDLARGIGLPILLDIMRPVSTRRTAQLGLHVKVVPSAAAGWHTPASCQTLYSLSVAPFVHDTVHQQLAPQLASRHCCRSPLRRAPANSNCFVDPDRDLRHVRFYHGCTARDPGACVYEIDPVT
jgi:hypothetical protein